MKSDMEQIQHLTNNYAPAPAGSCPADYKESLLSQMAGIRSNTFDHGVSQQHPWLPSPRIVAANSNQQQQYRTDQLRRELQTCTNGISPEVTLQEYHNLLWQRHRPCVSLKIRRSVRTWR
jgi:hypothetical protein